jgi:hypothetical protein
MREQNERDYAIGILSKGALTAGAGILIDSSDII